jgi:D-serine deaminase-like pyridoxal phosphate-dependent protein
LDGLFCYPGHIWELPDQQKASLQRVSDRLDEAVDLWHRHGLTAPIVSGGSTPTAYQSHLIPQLTEIRPGTYIFNDMNTVLGGFCSLADCAATVVCTVVSDAVPGKVVIDAGSKTFGSDRNVTQPESGFGSVIEYPQAMIVRLSEEHGEVDISRCDARPKLGDQINVIPNHICPCVNLQDSVVLEQQDGSLLQLMVEARGKLI